MIFRDLAKQYEVLRQDLNRAIMEVASSAHYIMGPQVQALEEQLAAYVGVKHCLTCANGTDALTLALKAWGVGAGDAIFVPDFTFFATAEVVALESATPVFVDVDAQTYNIDAVRLEEAIKKVESEGKLRPRAIIAVDLFGLPANYKAIRDIADRHGLLLLEDGAQGFGGSIDGKKACSFGDIATTSFFPAKPLGCYGDGGAIFTDNDEWATLIASYRLHGKGSDKYDNVRIGLNSRLDTIQAAILQVKLGVFDDELAKVNAAAQLYTELLCDHVTTPVIPEGFVSSWAQYTIQFPSSEKRNDVQKALKEAGIPSMIYYPKPMHSQTAFNNSLYPMPYGTYTSNMLCNTVLSLPIHPYITPDEIKQVAANLQPLTTIHQSLQ